MNGDSPSQHRETAVKLASHLMSTLATVEALGIFVDTFHSVGGQDIACARGVGDCYIELDKHAEALPYQKIHLDLATKRGLLQERCRALLNIGNSHFALHFSDADTTAESSHLEQCLSSTRQSLALATELNDLEMMTLCHLNIAFACELGVNNLAKAERAFQSVIDIADGLDRAQLKFGQRTVADNLDGTKHRAMYHLGQLLNGAGRFDEAQVQLQRARQMAKGNFSATIPPEEVSLQLGIAQRGQDQFKQAKATLRRAAKRIKTGRNKVGISTVELATRIQVARNLRIARTEVRLALGEAPEAAGAQDLDDTQRLKILEALGDLYGTGCLGQPASKHDKLRAIRSYASVVALAEEARAANGHEFTRLNEIYGSIAVTYEELEDFDKALEHYRLEYNCLKDAKKYALAVDALKRIQLCTALFKNQVDVPSEFQAEPLVEEAQLVAHAYVANATPRETKSALHKEMEHLANADNLTLTSVADIELTLPGDATDETGSQDDADDGADTDASLTESESEETAIQRPARKPGKLSSLNKKNEKGETKLHAQVIAGNLANVKKLLEDGATPNTSDHFGWTPLHEACNHGFVEIVELLLANPKTQVNTIGTHHCAAQKITPLLDAATQGNTEICQVLLLHKADPTLVDAKGKLPLDMANDAATFECIQGHMVGLGAPVAGRSFDDDDIAVFDEDDGEKGIMGAAPSAPSSLDVTSPPPRAQDDSDPDSDDSGMEGIRGRGIRKDRAAVQPTKAFSLAQLALAHVGTEGSAVVGSPARHGRGADASCSDDGETDDDLDPVEIPRFSLSTPTGRHTNRSANGRSGGRDAHQKGKRKRRPPSAGRGDDSDSGGGYARGIAERAGRRSNSGVRSRKPRKHSCKASESDSDGGRAVDSENSDAGLPVFQPRRTGGTSRRPEQQHEEDAFFISDDDFDLQDLHSSSAAAPPHALQPAPGPSGAGAQAPLGHAEYTAAGPRVQPLEAGPVTEIDPDSSTTVKVRLRDELTPFDVPIVDVIMTVEDLKDEVVARTEKLYGIRPHVSRIATEAGSSLDESSSVQQSVEDGATVEAVILDWGDNEPRRNLAGRLAHIFEHSLGAATSRDQDLHLDVLARVPPDAAPHVTAALQGLALGGESVSHLAHALSYNDWIRDLDISGNCIDDKDMRLLARALQRNVAITDLRLTSNNFTHAGLEHVLKADDTWLSQLSVLHVSFNDLSGMRSTTLSRLLRFGIELKELAMDGCGLAAQCGVKLFRDSPAKRRVSLAHNPLQMQGEDIVSLCLGSTVVDVSQTSFAKENSFVVGTGHIPDLRVNDQKEISLTLRGTKCGPKSVYQLNKVFKCCRVVDLDVSVCQLQSDSVASLLAAMNASKSLRRLDLSGNKIHAGVWEGIILLVREHTSLENLRLDSCSLQTDVVWRMLKEVVARAQTKGYSLATLCLAHNPVSWTTAHTSDLVSLASEAPGLLRLDLSGHSWTGEDTRNALNTSWIEYAPKERSVEGNVHGRHVLRSEKLVEVALDEYAEYHEAADFGDDGDNLFD